jgi:hypothetical protein
MEAATSTTIKVAVASAVLLYLCESLVARGQSDSSAPFAVESVGNLL